MCQLYKVYVTICANGKVREALEYGTIREIPDQAARNVWKPFRKTYTYNPVASHVRTSDIPEDLSTSMEEEEDFSNTEEEDEDMWLYEDDWVFF